MRVQVALKLRIPQHPVRINPRRPHSNRTTTVVRVHEVMPGPSRRRPAHHVPPNVGDPTPLPSRSPSRVRPIVQRKIRPVPTTAVPPAHQRLFIRNRRIKRPDFHRTIRILSANRIRRNRTHKVIGIATKRHRLDAVHRGHRRRTDGRESPRQRSSVLPRRNRPKRQSQGIEFNEKSCMRRNRQTWQRQQQAPEMGAFVCVVHRRGLVVQLTEISWAGDRRRQIVQTFDAHLSHPLLSRRSRDGTASHPSLKTASPRASFGCSPAGRQRACEGSVISARNGNNPPFMKILLDHASHTQDYSPCGLRQKTDQIRR